MSTKPRRGGRGGGAEKWAPIWAERGRGVSLSLFLGGGLPPRLSISAHSPLRKKKCPKKRSTFFCAATTSAFEVESQRNLKTAWAEFLPFTKCPCVIKVVDENLQLPLSRTAIPRKGVRSKPSRAPPPRPPRQSEGSRRFAAHKTQKERTPGVKRDLGKGKYSLSPLEYLIAAKDQFSTVLANFESLGGGECLNFYMETLSNFSPIASKQASSSMGRLIDLEGGGGGGGDRGGKSPLSTPKKEEETLLSRKKKEKGSCSLEVGGGPFSSFRGERRSFW